MSRLKQDIRNGCIALSNRVFKDPLLRKKLIVDFYNAKAKCVFFLCNDDSYNPFEPSRSLLKNRFHIDELYRGNGLYGIGAGLRSFSGHSKPLAAYIEHGLVLGDAFDEDMFDGAFPSVITMSDLRAQRFRNRGMHSIAIGPYISYVDQALSNPEFLTLKRAFGRVLLVFPCHSIEENQTSNSYEPVLIRECSRIAEENEIDTVVVSMYYNDFLLGRSKAFEKLGFKVFCAGNRYDPLFLSRLKSMLMLADYCVTDGVGTHIGYALSLQKPMEVVGNSYLDLYVDELERNEAHEIAQALASRCPVGQAAAVGRKYFNIGKELSASQLATELKLMDARLEARQHA